MRVTSVLWRQREGYHFKKLWENRKTLRNIVDFGIPKPLQEKGVQVYDALEVAAEKEEHVPFKPPEPYCIPASDARDRRNPNWHDREAYLVHSKTRLLEGDRHICLLTKTLRCEGLPRALRGPDSSEHDKAAKEALKRAYLGDCYQKKLPRHLDIARPHWRFPRDYDVPVSRRVSLLLSNYQELCEKVTSHEPGVMGRTLVRDLSSRVCVQKEDGNLVVMSSYVHSMLASKRPLPTASSLEEVSASASVPLPDLFPAKYTLDLDKSNIYPMDDIYPLAQCKQEMHVHTLHVTHPYDYYWFPQQKLARAILACFTFAAAQARHIYGTDTMTLPEPVTVQATYSDINSMGFLAYQLNTLDLVHVEGLKNQVWVEEAQPLYHTCSCEEGLQEHNPVPFRRFLALYCSQT